MLSLKTFQVQKLLLKTKPIVVIWRPPSLSELTPIILRLGGLHLLFIYIIKIYFFEL